MAPYIRPCGLVVRRRAGYVLARRSLSSCRRLKNAALAATILPRELASQSPPTPPYPTMISELRFRFLQLQIMSSVSIVDVLRKWHPNHTVTQTPISTGLLKLAKAGLATARLDTATDWYGGRVHKPALDDSSGPGRLKDEVEFGRYHFRWQENEFQIYVADYWESEYIKVENHYIVYPWRDGDVVEGRSKTVDAMIMAAGEHGKVAQEEIWVYDRGYWRKNHKLWENVQACRWEDVILDPEMKGRLIDDIEGFFDREEDYASFAVPWKRGIILHGLPGNGKTISIKALMRSLAIRPTPVPTLYVKSLGKSCDSDDIRTIFEKAREAGPCLLVLEDLDSLIKEDTRSFFLNEVDGLEGNDGIMLIGSTNYLDKLDAGISKRPSRFDRKYHFALPAMPERVRYCENWISKLSKTSSLQLPAGIASAIAKITEGFSFAYLQEAFVSALLSIVATQRANSKSIGAEESSTTGDLSSNSVWQAISKQVQTLRKEMKDSKKSVEDAEKSSVMSDARSSSGTSTGFGL